MIPAEAQRSSKWQHHRYGATANASKGIWLTAQHCGYGKDLAAFEKALHAAGKQIRVTIQGFCDLADQ